MMVRVFWDDTQSMKTPSCNSVFAVDFVIPPAICLRFEGRRPLTSKWTETRSQNRHEGEGVLDVSEPHLTLEVWNLF